MISKELFVLTMKDIEKEREFQDKLNNLFEEYCEDSSFMRFDLEDTIVRLLEAVFNDQENQWLSYCVYELDFLNKYYDGCTSFANGDMIDLSNWENVYDFLLSNMNK